VVFRVGSAEVLGQFWVERDALVLELGHIDGGGEGVLPTLALLAHRYAQRKRLATVQWRVHALRCAHPNAKLQRVLERRGFLRKTIPGSGECCYLESRVEQLP
jgi:hypothetical protein